jgi:hypothetical protein
MSSIDVRVTHRGFGTTSRSDTWWVTPLVVFLGLGAFLVYATWAAFQGEHYRFGPYLSPFYSPELFGDPEHAWFGGKPAWWPGFLPFSAALIILPLPGGFRFTCYYYRGAYYKAFWADPPSCAVGEPRKSYWGERSFPLIAQNIHRFFLYTAIWIWLILAYDVWEALWFPTAAGTREFGIGVGTIVLLVNVILLGGYAFGCHSLRHIVGGYMDRMSKAPVHRTTYDCVSCLNRRHMTWAWCSLFSVAFADIYVRMCSMGIWTDWRLI